MKRALAVFATVVAVFGFSACSTNASNKARPPQPPIDFRGQKTVDVDAESTLFTPPDIIISPGTTVTWHNKDPFPHNIMKATDAANFHGDFGVDAQNFGPGASYSYKFTTLGVDYFYVCTIHNGMTGRVEVDAGTSATTTTVKP